MPNLGIPQLIEIAILVVVLLFSVIIHEVAHGYVALRNGDPTARMLGRLTLNPIPHIDPIGTIILPLLLLLTHSPILFGWARPVPVNPLNFRNHKWGEISVSAAGPLSNLGLAVVFAVLFRLAGSNEGLLLLANIGVSLNIILALFNLIPIPPLDGSHILAWVLPRNLALTYQRLEPYGFILLLVLLYLGVFNAILIPFYRLIKAILLG
jgi:Zn-dependent protease